MNSFNFDYRSEGYFDGQGKGYQNALNLKKIRDQLRINRIGIITYTIRLDPNIPIEPYSKDVTQANDKFEVTIDRQHLYPVGFTNGQYYYIERNGHPLKLKADVYSGGNGGYHLSDILGILVAEQIRFNTFKFAI